MDHVNKFRRRPERIIKMVGIRNDQLLQVYNVWMNNKLMKKKTMIAMSTGRFDSGMRVNGKAMKFKSWFPNLIKISHLMQPSGFRNFFSEWNGFFRIDRQPE